MLSNCLFFAWVLWYRRLRAGAVGYVVFRLSWHGPFFHCLYMEYQGRKRVRIVSFVPVNPRHKMVPPPVFRGIVRWGDQQKKS